MVGIVKDPILVGTVNVYVCNAFVDASVCLYPKEVSFC